MRQYVFAIIDNLIMRRKYSLLRNIEKYIFKVNLVRHQKLQKIFQQLNSPKVTFVYFAKTVGLSQLFWSHDKYPFLKTMEKIQNFCREEIPQQKLKVLEEIKETIVQELDENNKEYNCSPQFVEFQLNTEDNFGDIVNIISYCIIKAGAVSLYKDITLIEYFTDS